MPKPHPPDARRRGHHIDVVDAAVEHDATQLLRPQRRLDPEIGGRRRIRGERGELAREIRPGRVAGEHDACGVDAQFVRVLDEIAQRRVELLERHRILHLRRDRVVDRDRGVALRREDRHGGAHGLLVPRDPGAAMDPDHRRQRTLRAGRREHVDRRSGDAGVDIERRIQGHVGHMALHLGDGLGAILLEHGSNEQRGRPRRQHGDGHRGDADHGDRDRHDPAGSSVPRSDRAHAGAPEPASTPSR